MSIELFRVFNDIAKNVGIKYLSQNAIALINCDAGKYDGCAGLRLLGIALTVNLLFFSRLGKGVNKEYNDAGIALYTIFMAFATYTAFSGRRVMWIELLMNFSAISMIFVYTFGFVGYKSGSKTVFVNNEN